MEYARSVMEESKLLFEALITSEARAKIVKRMQKSPFSGMARPATKPKGETGS